MTRETRDAGTLELATRIHALLGARPGEPLSIKDIRTRLDIPADDRRDLRRTLADAVEAGQLVALPGRRFMVREKGDTVEGTVAFSRGGLGFLTGITGMGLTEDPLIPPHELAGLLPRDRVRARLEKGRNGRLRAADVVPVDAHPVLLGVLRAGGKRFSLEVEGVPDALRVGGAEDGLELLDGAMVEARVEVRPDVRHTGTVHVTAILGQAGTVPVEVERLIRASGAPVPFSPAALKFAEEASGDILAEAAADPLRQDIRELPLVTIDGETAKDFDDAVHVQVHGKDMILTVAIADVSHYVRDGSALDKDAVERGTSIYFPRRVIPMLPERLSNDLCSLRPHVPRLCMVARMTFGPQDVEPRKVDVFPGLMRSAARLTYTRVQQGRDMGLRELPEAPGFDMDAAYDLYKRLRDARAERGAVDLDIPEPEVTLDLQGEPVALHPMPRLDAHRLIESFMIAANEAVARFFAEHEVPSVYRVHEPPDPDKLSRFRDVANIFARGVHLKDNPGPMELSRFLGTVRTHPSAAVLQTMLLRSMMQARYDTQNLGHYGLASTAYLHFTSPIRRYPDLLVHRELRRFLEKKGPRRARGARAAEPDVAAEKRSEELQALAEKSSQCERRSTDLERKLDALYMTRWCQRHVGQSFDGVLSGLSEHGLFMQLPSLGAEGFVPHEGLAALGRERWELHPTGAFIFQERSGRRLSLGTPMVVKIVAADLARRQVQLEIVQVHGLASDAANEGAGEGGGKGSREFGRERAPAMSRGARGGSGGGNDRRGGDARGHGGQRGGKRDGRPGEGKDGNRHGADRRGDRNASRTGNQGGKQGGHQGGRQAGPDRGARDGQARNGPARDRPVQASSPRQDDAARNAARGKLRAPKAPPETAETPHASPQSNRPHADKAQHAEKPTHAEKTAQGGRRAPAEPARARPSGEKPADRAALAAARARELEERAAARRAGKPKAKKP